ncbi:hypothetical protein RirG_109310 [Rhizophagus irregularis DAOM 197198w]|uniref:Uncharacterized protein n=1 Tax=Rhizophagus irregularis (strain DAOM 197198w) TaxID=1432141 RepID=A0A015L611_RHIIW|nr:hypothetical protein RirG_109310 [Rhizophagus irregularis DAOM 197198w]
MSNSPSETNADSGSARSRKRVCELKDSSDLKDEKQNTASETKSLIIMNEEFAKRLGIKEFTENKDEWVTHREVFDYIVDPIWKPNGKELATNTIEYRLLESGDLDESKRTHVLLVHGKVIRYGDKISSEEHKELQKKFPGCFYAPTVERIVELCRFSAVNDNERKEWQGCMIYLIYDNKVIDGRLADGWEEFTVRSGGYCYKYC